MELLEAIKTRKSVRSYDPAVTIPTAEIEKILNLALLAPSGNNLQPWKVVVIRNQEIKNKLKGAAFGQEQVAEAPVVFALLGDRNGHHAAKKIYDLAVAAGFMTQEAKVEGLSKLEALYGSLDMNKIERKAIIDTSLLAMNLMLVVKEFGYDSVPMCGYNPTEVSNILELPDNLFPIMLLPVGKAQKPAHNTVRLALDDVVRFID